MPLITRGRLSVQRVSAECWEVIRTMADKGGWDNISFEKKKAVKARHPVDETRSTTSHQTIKRSTRRRKRKASTSSREDEEQDVVPRHKSLRRS